MTLKSGTQLRSYEIISAIGKGGMGEVYQAKDLKLGREVAIKVLPEEFAKEADRVARFQREAKLLASLNHPNIAAIYGLEESNGTNFLVLELVEGETLADQIKRGPIPVEESLKLALQIAEALEAAHEKGVIHRDLKPANIKITPDDKVKVLDFGLAKAFAGEQAEMNLSASPTLSHLATQQGIILGTAAYMSPEQARGKSVDKRADIWAFGCVLYEMLTGRAAFQGEDITEILASVVKGGANLDLLPANIHPRVREVITRCLQKEQKRRYSGAGDMQYEIEQVLADPGGLFILPVTTKKSRTKVRLGLPWVAACVVLVAIVAGVAVWKLKPSEPRQVTRFSQELPKEQQFSDMYEKVIAVSPDGRQFVYATSGGLYLRSLDELDAKLLPGTAGNRQRPFFSPDGKSVGYWNSSDNKLKKIAISGGAPVTLADASVVGSFDWGADDTIVYGQAAKAIMRISANGGTQEAIVKAVENEFMLHPQILPDGRSVLFTGSKGIPPLKIMVQSLQSGERKELFEGNSAKYLSTGHIVYELGGNLFAVPFDLNSLKVVGGPVSIVEGVMRTGGAPQYDVSDSGTLVYVPGAASAAGNGRTLTWVSRDGTEEALSAEAHYYNTARISPDGTKVALQFDQHISVWDLVRNTMTRLTFDGGSDSSPLWTPDGRRIVFASNREGGFKVYWKAADGTGKEELLASVPGTQNLPAAWSKDGKTLVLMGFTEAAGASSAYIGALSMEGDRKYRPLLKEKYNEVQPQISHNGQWMAYASDESGRSEVYVRPFPDVDGGRWQVSTGGGDSPLWSRDGRELFYHNGNAVMVVPVKTEPTFSQETPKTLFQGTYHFPTLGLRVGQAVTNLYRWDICPDGKRFLMMKPPGTSASPEGGPRKINIVLNWTEELKQRVPTGKN